MPGFVKQSYESKACKAFFQNPGTECRAFIGTACTDFSKSVIVEKKTFAGVRIICFNGMENPAFILGHIVSNAKTFAKMSGVPSVYCRLNNFPDKYDIQPAQHAVQVGCRYYTLFHAIIDNGKEPIHSQNSISASLCFTA